jgi:NAD(P)-dependent dehydrogenase (short-subunit alcohol dehydrogenase family)
VAIVSGGGSGLGRATAVELAALGARVVVCWRRQEPLEETAALVHGGQVEAHSCDIREEDQVGKIVNVTLSPHHGLPGMAHSSAARAAVENLTRVLSIEWARFGIRLVALAAGQFGTETLRTKYPKPVVEGVAGTVPLGRLGTEEEFAWLVAYLATPAGDFVSGSVLTIDGARDNWFGAWPPTGLTGEGGKPPAEERRPKQ